MIVLHEVILLLVRVAHPAPIAGEAASVISRVAITISWRILLISVGALCVIRHSLHTVAKETVFERYVVRVMLLGKHWLLRLLGLHEAPIA